MDLAVGTQEPVDPADATSGVLPPAWRRLRSAGISIVLFFVILGGLLVLCAPLALFESWAPFLAHALLALAFGVLRKRIRLPDRPVTYGAAFVVAFLVLCPLTFMARFFESGLDDGPYPGRTFSGDIAALTASESVPYQSGRLVVYNRGALTAPVVAYEVEGRTQWASELHLSRGGGAGSGLDHISGAFVSYGRLRNCLSFRGKGTFGQERGRAYIWKSGGVHRFYLSW